MNLREPLLISGTGFCRLDVLSASQLTVSKHWIQQSSDPNQWHAPLDSALTPLPLIGSIVPACMASGWIILDGVWRWGFLSNKKCIIPDYRWAVAKGTITNNKGPDAVEAESSSRVILVFSVVCQAGDNCRLCLWRQPGVGQRWSNGESLGSKEHEIAGDDDPPRLPSQQVC